MTTVDISLTPDDRRRLEAFCDEHMIVPETLIELGWIFFRSSGDSLRDFADRVSTPKKPNP